MSFGKLSHLPRLFLSLFLLNACAPTTSAELRATPGETAKFDVRLPLKQVYQNFINKINQCYVYRSKYGSLIKKEVVPGQYYIVEYFISTLGVQFSIDLRQNDDSTTVTYFKDAGFAAGYLSFYNFHQIMIDIANDQNDC